MHIQEEKAILRKTMKQRLASHQQFPKSKQQEAASLDTMQQQEASAIQLLFQEPQYQHADSILAYAALPGELSVDQLIQQALDEGKKVFLPKSYPDNCSMEFHQLENHLPYTQQVVCGSYGIREPLSSREKYHKSDKTLVLVPGLAFTRTGQRLGRGKGFYDRFLARLSADDCYFMGVCHQWQIVERIPTEATDIQLDFLLTPQELISCKK